jgi:hypothetical protein
MVKVSTIRLVIMYWPTRAALHLLDEIMLNVRASEA